jgi:cytoskeletal protein RodZ
MPESIGKILKKKREAKKLSIEEVSKKTRIPRETISAIEEDNLKEISSPFYAKTFIQTYARFLGVSEEKEIKELLNPPSSKKQAAVPPKEKVKSPVLRNNILKNWFKKYKKQLVTVIIAAFGLWVIFFSLAQLQKTVKNIFAKHKIRAAEQQKKDKETAVKEEKKQKKSSEAEEKEKFQLKITAGYNTWLRLKADGKLLFSGTLKKKTSDVWEAKKEIELELGNAGAVTLTLNGKDIGSPGKKGEKKAITVTKDGIK